MFHKSHSLMTVWDGSISKLSHDYLECESERAQHSRMLIFNEDFSPSAFFLFRSVPKMWLIRMRFYLFGATDYIVSYTHSRHTNAKYLHMPYIIRLRFFFFLALPSLDSFILSLHLLFFCERLKVSKSLLSGFITFCTIDDCVLRLFIWLSLSSHSARSILAIWIINVKEEGEFMLLTLFAIETIRTLTSILHLCHTYSSNCIYLG